MSQSIQHHLGIVVELHAEPVPPGFFRAQRIREKLVIHPRRPFYGKVLPLHRDRSPCVQSRERNVMRGVALSRRLLAHSVFPMHNQRLPWLQRQLDRKLLSQPLQSLTISLPLDLPVPIPDTLLLQTCTGDPGSLPVETFGVIELPAIQIAHGKMREIEIPHRPYTLHRIAIYALAEERELKAKPMSIRGLHVSRVVPPL